MKKLYTRIALVAVVLLACAAQVQAQSFVYDNTTTDLSVNFNPGTTQIGNEVTLAGTDRTVNYFSFQYWGDVNLSASANVTLRFWANDGPANGAAAHEPGTLLYQSDPFNIVPTARSPIEFSTALGDFGGTGVVVPDTFTWTVTFNNLGSGNAGVNFYGPPTVGTVYNDYWANSGSGWSLLTYDPAPTFAARIGAVPEPTTMALLGLGGLAGLAWRRRKN